MRAIRYNVAVSLDGFIAPPDESTNWIVDDKSIDFQAIYSEFDVFVMGRKTYEAIASMGAHNTLGGRPKENVIVISRQLDSEQHPDITILKDNFIETIRMLKKQSGRDVWVMGGGWLAAACLEAGLLDAVETAIMPVILGRGYSLVPQTGQQHSYKLVLEKAESLETGIIMAKYRVSY